MELGKLTKVDLRTYWEHEALEFTPWLATPENIELLADEVGIGIRVVGTEASVGPFAVDILAEEENTGRKIIIENQLERTDHTHLGQLITYAAGLEAGFIIWIVRDAREEHQQAVDWLNEHTDEDINFFVVLIELWRIGDSVPAPKFTAICRPNEWTRLVRTTDVSATRKKQLDFWQRLKEYAAGARPELKLRTPRPRDWFNVKIGRADCHVALIVDSREDKVRCDLYIPDSKELYKALLANRARIETELGLSLEWRELPDKKASRLRALHDFNFSDESTWDQAFVWLIETASRFQRVFAKDWTPPSS
jgi:hypothetical protein